MSKNAILIYEVKDAPDDIRWCAGDDSDWIAVIPPDMVDVHIPWMQTGSSFGCCDVNEVPHPVKEGWKIRVGYHS